LISWPTSVGLTSRVTGPILRPWVRTAIARVELVG
jgi:hypothetical protein